MDQTPNTKEDDDTKSSSGTMGNAVQQSRYQWLSCIVSRGCDEPSGSHGAVDRKGGNPQYVEVEFGRAKMFCEIENLFEDGQWAILEWKDPLGLRGCGFFHIVDGQIVFQRGYFDQQSFFKQQGLPVPSSYLSLD